MSSPLNFLITYIMTLWNKYILRLLSGRMMQTSRCSPADCTACEAWARRPKEQPEPGGGQRKANSLRPALVAASPWPERTVVVDMVSWED